MTSAKGKALCAAGAGASEVGLQCDFQDIRSLAPIQANFAPVTVVIGGQPVAKGRPRMTRKGFCYTPSHTKKFEAHGRLAAQMAMGDRPPIAGPVKLLALVELPVPASWSKTRAQAALAGNIRPTTRPDLDNYLKGALDCLNTIVLSDAAPRRFGTGEAFMSNVIPFARRGSDCSNAPCPIADAPGEPLERSGRKPLRSLDAKPIETVGDAHRLPQTAVLLWELPENGCRWPVGDHDGSIYERLFCGQASADGSSYCRHHRELSLESIRGFAKPHFEQWRPK